MTAADVQRLLARTHRDEWATVVGSLTRRFGSLDIAEEAAADAFTTAVERWTAYGAPPNPGGWIMTTATRKALDRIRRESLRDAKHAEALLLYDDEPPAPVGVIDDDRLRLIFTCCHPSLSLEARVALTLRMVGGLTVSEIAHAFFVSDSTMGQRISRAKRKIADTGVPFRMPTDADLEPRVNGVLAVLYLVFNEGYLPSATSAAARAEVSSEAIRLARLLHSLLPEHGDVTGLLDRLALLDPSPHVALNRTVALAEVDGARAGLASLHSLEDALGDDYAFHAVRADLLRRLGRSGPAREAYDSAIARVSNPAQAAFLAQRRDSLD